MIKKWKGYLVEFENKVLIPLYESGEFGIVPEPVPLRAGKLRRTPFAAFIGASFVYNDILSFNYYGLFKPSKGITQIPPAGQNTIQAPVIHFSSVKIEHIEAYEKALILDFVAFKKFLVELRWRK